MRTLTNNEPNNNNKVSHHHGGFSLFLLLQTLKSSTADEVSRGGDAPASGGFDFGLMIYFALWYLG